MAAVETVRDTDSDKGTFRDKKTVSEMDEETLTKVNVTMIDSYSKRK